MPSPLSPKIRDALSLAEEFDEVCFRNLAYQYATKSQALSTGSKRTGGRYNPKDEFGALYLSLNLHTCLEEVVQAQSLSAIEIAPKLPRVDVAIKVRLSKILNLTNPVIQRAIGITEADLIIASDLEDQGWHSLQRSGRVESTQLIGRLTREAGFEALLVPSAKFPGKNLVVFYPENILPTSQILLLNEDRLPD